MATVPPPSARDPRLLVHYAALAPSSHNTQPWFFRLSGGIELWSDRTRALPANDPFDRELSISCGCALMNLRVAASHFGRLRSWTLQPEPGLVDLLARVELADSSDSPGTDAALFEALERRRTYRKAFRDEPVAPAVLAELEAAAAAEGAWLEVLTSEDARLAVADLVAEGDAAQWSDPSWRRELAAWMHPRRRGDGLTVPWLAAPLAQAVVRTFDLGDGLGAKDRKLAEGSPVLAVLGTERDGLRSWLEAGLALERVLLELTRHGLAASFLNQPIQIATLRPRLQSLLGRPGWPQVLLRLGHPASDVPAAPRRPLADVLDAG